MRGWGRAWDVLYWSGAVVALAAGLVLPIRSGVVLLGLAGFLLVLAPFRGRPGTFWPVLSGYLAFAVGFTLVGVLAADPVGPGLAVGSAGAVAAAVAARAVTRARRAADGPDDGGRP